MDISYLLLLQSLRESTGGIFNNFFAYVTTYGETAVLTLIFALIYWCINKKTGEYILLSLAFARVLNGLSKITACVYRPWIRDGRIVPAGNAIKAATGYSFPSGHTTNATATFGGFANRVKDEKVLKFVAWGIALLVGFSRNYLGVHTPQDVIVGFAATVLVLFAVQKLFQILEKNGKADIWVAVGGILLCFVGYLYAANKSYPMDYNKAGKLLVDPAKMVLDFYKNIGFASGVFIGWLLERRFVQFSVEGSVNQKILRFIICYFLFHLLNLVLVPMITSGLPKELGSWFKPFAQGLYICFIAPVIIKLTSGRFQQDTSYKEPMLEPVEANIAL